MPYSPQITSTLHYMRKYTPNINPMHMSNSVAAPTKETPFDTST